MPLKMNMAITKTKDRNKTMKKIQLLLGIALSLVSSFSFSEEQATGFYAVEDNGDTILLTIDNLAVLESDGEIYQAETSRDGYRAMSDEEAKFLEALAKQPLDDEYWPLDNEY